MPVFPATVHWITQKNCFVNLPAEWISDIQKSSAKKSRTGCVVLRVSSSSNISKNTFLGWSGSSSFYFGNPRNSIEIDGDYARLIDLGNGDEILLEPTDMHPECVRIVLVLDDASSWLEISAHGEFIEQHLLEVIRVVSLGMKFPIWIETNGNKFHTFEIAKMEPAFPFTILVPETIVEILPNNRSLVEVSANNTNSTSPSFFHPEYSFPLTSMIWDMFVKRASPLSTSVTPGQTAAEPCSEKMEKMQDMPLFCDRKEQPEHNPEYSAVLRVQEIFPVDRTKEPPDGMDNIAIVHYPLFNCDMSMTSDCVVQGSLQVIPVPAHHGQSDTKSEKSSPSLEISLRLVCNANESVIKRGHIGFSRSLLIQLSLIRFTIVRVSFLKSMFRSAEEPKISAESVFTSLFRRYSVSLASTVFPTICEYLVNYADLALSLTKLSSTDFHPAHYFVFPGVLLLGAVGTGKTTVIMDVADKLGCAPYLVHCEIIQCKLIRGKRPDTLRKLLEALLEEAIHKQPSVLFFDDVEYLAANITNDNDTEIEYSYRVAHILVDVLNVLRHRRDRVLFVATSTSRDSVHELLVNCGSSSVFHRFLDIPVLQLDGRKLLLKMLFEEEDDLCDKDVKIEEMAEKTDGFIMRDFRLVLKKIRNGCILSGNKSKDGRLSVPPDIITAALESTVPASMQKVTTSRQLDLSASWDDVGGMQSVKKLLKEIFELPVKYPKLYAKCPLRLPRGVLLYGLPGTGKTFIAGVTAKEMGIGLIYIRGPELLSKYIGASESKVRDVFERARAAKPCLILFDEFDAIAPRRGHDSTGVTDRVVNQLLTEMDGIESLDGVFIIAATSRPELIDPAILRPGRIDKCLYCPIPTRDDRLEILTIFARKVTLDADVDLKKLADLTDNFTGADLKSVVTDAQLYAIEKHLQDTFPVGFTASVTEAAGDVSVDRRNDRGDVGIDKEMLLQPKTVVKIRQEEIVEALQGRLPSVSEEDRIRYESMANDFTKEGASHLYRLAKPGTSATLA